MWTDDQPFNESGYRLGVESQIFNTKSNYNSKGNEQDLLSGRSYNLVSGRLYGSLDWNEKIRAIFSGGYAKATSNNGLGNGDQSNSGFTDVEFKAYLESGFRPWIFRPYARALIPIQRVGLTTRTPIYAEGAMEAELGARLGYEILGLIPYLEAGIRYQDEGRASLLPWHIGAQYNYSAFIAGLEFYGQEVLKKDSKSDDLNDKRTVTDYANGGSLKFYSADPNYYEVRAYLGVSLFERVLAKIGFGQTLRGSNSAAGQTIYANLEFRFGEEKSDPRQDRFEAPPESYDQKLFQEEVTPSMRKRSNALEKDFDKIMDDANPNKPGVSPRKQQTLPKPQRPVQPKKSNALDEEFESMKIEKPRPTKQQIKQKQMLDDVEKSLEKKK